ncbi:MAG: hypothetical protein IJ055_02710 [Oscillospiraceae bacterium]|nr:hypothetical protein [Oscillospiraceae bacterium]
MLTLLLSFLLYAFIISRIFAYYSSDDEVTNRITGKSIGLELYEPEWDAVGSKMARASEPGMVIPKDPYAKNTGNMDEVVRLHLTIRLDESIARPPSGNAQHEDMLQKATDTERKIAILRAILYENGGSFVTVQSGTQAASGNTIPVTDEDGDKFIVSYQGSDFLIEDAQRDGEAFDFYFYYIGNNYIGGTTGTNAQGVPYDYSSFTREETVMETLSPEESTSKLFHKLAYPIYKTDYLTVFDQGYTIDVYAEGILCKDLDARKLGHTVENFKKLAAE